MGHPVRLIKIKFPRRTLGNAAEPATPGADISEDHERRSARAPAFGLVWTRRTAANRLEVIVPDQITHLHQTVVGREPYLEPGREALWKDIIPHEYSLLFLSRT
jgi:hypothetical protein